MTNKYLVIYSTDMDINDDYNKDIYVLLKKGKTYYYVSFNLDFTPFTCGMYFIGNVSPLYRISKIDKKYYKIDGSVDYDLLLSNIYYNTNCKSMSTFPKAAADEVLNLIRDEFSFAYLLASDRTGEWTGRFCRAAGFKTTERITNPNSGNKIQLFYKTFK